MSAFNKRFSVVLLCMAFLRPGMAVELSMREVATGVYVHQGIHELPDANNHGEIANIGFIIGRRCVAVIDTGGSPGQGRALRQAVERVTQLPVCYVVNSHMHPDHVYGNRAFKQPGTQFVGHYKLAEALAMRAPSYREKAERDLGFKINADDFVLPDLEVRDTRVLDLGGREIELTAHGSAHTNNDLSVFDRETGTLWLADLLFIDHLPVIDGSLNGWLHEIERLRSHPATRVVPGHGPVVTNWPGAADAEVRYLTTLRTEIRAALKNNRTMEQAIDNVGRSERGYWSLFDEFHRRNVSAAFAELEWEDP